MTLLDYDLAARRPSVSAFLARGPHRLLIDGEWVAPSSGDYIESLDPATGTILTEIARGTSADVDDAVSAARRALESPAWSRMTPAARSALLWRLADLIEQHIDELSELETLDQGKAYRTARFGELPGTIAQFRYYAGYTNKLLGTTIPTSIAHQPEGKQIFAYTVKEPVGVVAAIVPWNSPLLMASMKLAPALAAGCTVVLKPSENTSLTALRLGELALEAGFPAGVVNVVTGYGREVGQALAEHPGVDKIGFTGSTAVGKALLVAAQGNLKRLTLELGGKSPAIVMPDADFALAVPGIARGIFNNGGQVCVASSRVYAHSSIYERLVEEVSREADALSLGHGMNPATDMGPMVSMVQADRVAEYVREGVADGVEVTAGGLQVDEQRTFYRPTVLTGVRQEMRLMQEEIFGPVVSITPFDEVDEVVAWANDSVYGLAASVWTEGLSNAHTLTSRIKAGTVWVNCHSYFSPELPKGGHKKSGWGYENGAQGIENYLESKTVVTVY
ncbi:aldehyde dehydrogenase family protein [Subtercola frigoramans]|uniref:Acyl-CoA reductase-like NAD-dependent aldehyde dehydrogenase n=1 Tax=Subtercola frigoramans TaxID=120298 RepID=A0ABS2L4W5_9MICO|nr:aldehyde dehydrogenase family protein [Subtercola frigoramans]MBM7472140.1 acyl-CoA reductase-like NAD-dependent aldehyde dehydrogenase [Subtercola frigoramans]